MAAASLDATLTSNDAVNWERHASGIFPRTDVIQISSITYGHGRFVAVANRTIINSTNGANWTEVSWFSSNNQFSPRCVVFGGGRFVVVGRIGSFLTSNDGLNWTERPLGTQHWFLSAAYGNGRVVGVGSNDPLWIGADARTLNFVTSTDGLNWNEQVFGPWPGNDGGNLSIAHGNRQFAVLAGSGHPLLTSSDGLAWTQRNVANSQGFSWWSLGSTPALRTGTVTLWRWVVMGRFCNLVLLSCWRSRPAPVPAC